MVNYIRNTVRYFSKNLLLLSQRLERRSIIRSELQIKVPIKVDSLEYSENQVQDEITSLELRRIDISNDQISSFVNEWFVQYLYEKPKQRYMEYLVSAQYTPKWLKRKTRKVFFDLETYHLPGDKEIKDFYPTASTNYFSKQRVGAAVSIDDQGYVSCWEEWQVGDFIQYLLGFDEIVSFNGLQFDNYVLAGYIKSDDVVQELYNKSFDLMRFLRYFDNISFFRPLNYYANSILQDSKLDVHGGSRNVPSLLREGSKENVVNIWAYCFKDTYLLVELYQKLPINVEMKLKYWEREIDDLRMAISNRNQEILRSLRDTVDESMKGLNVKIQNVFKKLDQERKNILLAILSYAKKHHQDFLSYVLFCQDHLIECPHPILDGLEFHTEHILFWWDPDDIAEQELSVATEIAFSVKSTPFLNDFGNVRNIFPSSATNETDFFKRARFRRTEAFSIKGVDNNLYAICDRIMQTFPLEEMAERYEKIFYNSITAKAEQYLVQRKLLANKFKTLSLENLLDNGVIGREQYAPETNFPQFLEDTVVPNLVDLFVRYTKEVAIMAQEALEEYEKRCQSLIQILEENSISETSGHAVHKSMLLEVLRCRYSLAYAKYLLCVGCINEIQQEDLDQLYAKIEAAKFVAERVRRKECAAQNRVFFDTVDLLDQE